MAKKGRSVGISKLARYAADPNDIFKNVDRAKTQYGTRAHDAVGKRSPLVWLVIIIAVAVLAYIKLGGS